MKLSEQLLYALRGDCPWSAIPTDSYSPDETVNIEPTDIMAMLKRYLNGTRSEKELQEWASWVLTRDEFVVKGWEDDSVADNYEPMWLVLQKLSTPFIDGDIANESIENYVSVLSAL